ncbi:MAG: flagellar biosynthesis anti-sigma factor FlgM [Thermoguttaceae bacterium]
MEIGATLAVYGSQKVSGAQRAFPTTAARETAGKPTISGDELTLSPAAKLSQAMATNRSDDASSSGPIRFDLVNRVRAEIAAGTYDTPDKMSLAFDRMLASAMR